jgi:hypothetical protein
MPAKKGQPKVGGRQKGTQNKSTQALFGTATEVLQAIGFNPLTRMAEIANGKNCPNELVVKACAEIAKYVYSQRRSIDIQEMPAAPIAVRYGWVPEVASKDKPEPEPVKPEERRSRDGHVQ